MPQWMLGKKEIKKQVSLTGKMEMPAAMSRLQQVFCANILRKPRGDLQVLSAGRNLAAAWLTERRRFARADAGAV